MYVGSNFPSEMGTFISDKIGEVKIISKVRLLYSVDVIRQLFMSSNPMGIKFNLLSVMSIKAYGFMSASIGSYVSN